MEWDQRATALLLANLDYNIDQFEKDGVPRDKKLLLHKLQEQLRKAGIVRSQKKIDLRFHRLWKDNRNQRLNESYEKIYRSGTKCLRNLDPILRRAVQRELTAIWENKHLVLATTPRTLRSGSQSLGLDTPRSRSMKRESTIPNDTASPNSPLSRKGELQLQQMSGSPECTSQASRTTFLLVQPTPESSVSSPIPQIPHQTTEDAETKDEFESSQSGDALIYQTPPSFAKDATCGSIGIQNPDSIFYEFQMQQSSSLDWNGGSLEKEFSTSGFLNWSPETLRDLFNDAQYFRRKWLVAETERRRLEGNERLYFGLPRPNNEVGMEDALKERIKSQYQEITSLKAKSKIQESLEPFFQGQEVVSQNLERIRHEHNDMARGLKTAFLGFAYLSNVYEELAAIHSKDLNDLKDFAHISSSTSTKRNIRDPVLVIESLAGAAVCNWVLEGQIQCFAMVSTPLLTAYQDILRTLVGDENSQSVDFAAHQRVIDSEPFQHAFLPQIAGSLAQRFIGAIQPLVEAEMSTRKKKDFENSLKSVFLSALKIRMQGLAARGSFEIIWPKSGSCFNRRFMALQSPGTFDSDRDRSEQKSRTVVLAVVPGFRVRNKSNGLVDYHGFTMQDGEKIEDSHLVVPAVVISG